MKKSIALLISILILFAFAGCAQKADDPEKLQGDEKEAFAAVEKYYKATGQLDVRTCMEALFPEALEKQLKNYGGSIDKYVETVEKYVQDKEKTDVTVEFKSIDRNKYSSNALEKEAKALANVYGIDASGVEKIVNLSFDLKYTEGGTDYSDSESCDVCKYKGKWYISPARNDQSEQETKSTESTVSLPEALENAVSALSSKISKGGEIEIVNAPSDTDIMNADREYTYIAIVDNDFFETTGGYPYQSLQISGISDNNYIAVTGEFSLSEDNSLILTVTANNNTDEPINDSQIISVTVGKNSLKKGNAVRFKTK